MEKYHVKETSSGEIVLINDEWQIETHSIHKEIWKKNYLNKEVIENKNFSIQENIIEYDLFQVIANPIIEYK
jgi:hypothetical protein